MNFATARIEGDNDHRSSGKASKSHQKDIQVHKYRNPPLKLPPISASWLATKCKASKNILIGFIFGLSQSRT